MIEEEKRAIDSLHGILNDLLAKNLDIYGAAIANPSGHIVTSDFQSDKLGFSAEIEYEKEIQEKKGNLREEEKKSEDSGKTKESRELEESEKKEETEESEKWSKDKSSIFVLAFSYGMMFEVIEKIGKFLGKGKIKSMYIKSTYSNLVIMPITPMTNLLLVITSGKGFDFRFFRESNTLTRPLVNIGGIKQLDEQVDEHVEKQEDKEEENQEVKQSEKQEDKLEKTKEDESNIDEFFHELSDELPGLLGTGHVGIKEHMGSYQLFGSFKKDQTPPEKKNEKNAPDEILPDIVGMLSYLFYMGQRLIEERNLEFDLIQLQYEQGHVLLKPHRNIAFIFDTEEPFSHIFTEHNLPAPTEFQDILQKFKRKSEDMIKIYENVDEWLEKGLKLLKKKQPREAGEYFNKAVETKSESPYDANFWFTTGIKMGEKAKYKQAVACFEQVHREDPNNVKSWIKQAKAYYYMDQVRKAIECMKKAIQLDKMDEEIWFRIAELKNEVKIFRKTVHYYKNGLQLKPHSPKALRGLGHAYFELKQYRKAIRIYKKFLEIGGDESAAWIAIGWTLNKLKKYHRAIECFDTAISIDPDSAVAWNNKGACFYRLKNYDEAMECCKKSMDLDPLLQYPWGNIGEINEKRRNYQIAADYFKQAIRLDPKDKDYPKNLRKTERKLKRAKRIFLRKLSNLSKSKPKIPINELNDNLQDYIKPLLKMRTNLEDLLHHLIRNNQLKAKITEEYVEFV